MTSNEDRGEIIIYRAPDNTVQLDVRMAQETVWLTPSQMAILFDRDVKTIRKHINNALREELDKSLVVAKIASTKKYGRREGYTLKYYRGKQASFYRPVNETPDVFENSSTVKLPEIVVKPIKED